MNIVDVELGAEEVESGVIDGFGVSVGVGVSVDGAEFAVPDGGFVRKHEFGFAEELALEAGFLVGGAGESFASREAHCLLRMQDSKGRRE